MANPLPNITEPVTSLARKDSPLLRQSMTIQQALDAIRTQGVGEKIIYFYAIDEEGRLKGVVPTRRLLTAPLNTTVADIMAPSVVAIPAQATILEACEYFVLHRFLAFPVVDADQHVVGVVDVGQFTNEVFDIAEREEADTVFESLGFHVAELRGASAFKAWGLRFPWLLATIFSGTCCALLSGAFEATLAQSLVIAFFLALVLGLGESVAMQSMTVTIQTLKAAKPTFAWFRQALRRELFTALLLGLACGTVVATIVYVWRGDALAAGVIGCSILCALVLACVWGLGVPWLLHMLKWDPKIAAGPVALAMADLSTLLVYFTLATVAMRK
jgi:magnesium transporter